MTDSNKVQDHIDSSELNSLDLDDEPSLESRALADSYGVKLDSKGMPINAFNLFEFAGSFGDLGILIPFIVGYISIVGLHPQGVVLAFALALIGTGIYYKTPVPVQPMKAIGGAAIATPGLSAGAVYGASLFTGIFWLIAGRFKQIQRIRNFVSKPVLRGIMFGLGFVLITQSFTYIKDNYILAFIGIFIIFALVTSKRIPAMLVLLIVGAIAAIILNQDLLSQIISIRPKFTIPQFSLPEITLSDLAYGTVILALPQIPLTLGNAVIAIVEENNRLFSYRKIDESQIATSKGIINILAAAIGGVPMCHGAGGMAAHIRYGAHTGGATIILGLILLVLALFFSDSILILTELFPKAFLGVILLFAGIELAMSSRDVPREKSLFYLFLVTAAFSILNVALGFIVGVILQTLIQKEILYL
ncbi:MAG: putative sulfate/molybdate transporter [Coriobacteriia bacterium]|nr:putative sulfate/molybdate transporter [Coriobacteriia bacterium]